LSYTRKSASADYQTWDIVSFLFCIVNPLFKVNASKGCSIGTGFFYQKPGGTKETAQIAVVHLRRGKEPTVARLSGG